MYGAGADVGLERPCSLLSIILMVPFRIPFGDLLTRSLEVFARPLSWVA